MSGTRTQTLFPSRSRSGWMCGALLAAVMVSACGTSHKQPVSLQGHLSAETEQQPVSVPAHHARPHPSGEETRNSPEGVPAPVRHSYTPPVATSTRTETYSVVAHEVPVRDLLFALARDAKLNVDIHPGLSGKVTMNAIQQTLPQILDRIARQVDMRVELEGENLAVMPDTPFLRHYSVDYVNMSRSASGDVAASTQIASGLPGNSGSYDSAVNTSFMASNDNGSSTKVENRSGNHFWESLEQGIKNILRETDRIFPDGVIEEFSEADAAFTSTPVEPGAQAGRRRAENATGSNGQSASVTRRPAFREAAAVIVHRETGTVTARATGQQHKRIQEFIDRVANAARRQVMIEATIVEVELSDGYQQGIEWNRFWDEGRKLFSITQVGAGSGSATNVLPFSINYSKTSRNGNLLSATLSLLESFGSARVLSSPRLSVLNNQTALLKVVENVVYFNIRADVTSGGVNSNPVIAYSSTPQTVSVGLVMAVTPQISENDMVILNVRPTISSIAGMVKDPNPDIPSHVANEIPQIRTREIESVMRLGSGEIAVLGGLMEDRMDRDSRRVPIAGSIPLVKELFSSRNETAKKSELVIFLRPVVIQDAALAGDFSDLKGNLPDRTFWTDGTDASATSR